MIISKKKREKALRLIIDFEAKRKKDTYITEEYLIYHGFDKLEALQTLEVLNGMGYIKYNNKPRVSEKYISLTDKGICYFETKKDARVEFNKIVLKSGYDNQLAILLINLYKYMIEQK